MKVSMQITALVITLLANKAPLYATEFQTNQYIDLYPEDKPSTLKKGNNDIKRLLLNRNLTISERKYKGKKIYCLSNEKREKLSIEVANSNKVIKKDEDIYVRILGIYIKIKDVLDYFDCGEKNKKNIQTQYTINIDDKTYTPSSFIKTLILSHLDPEKVTIKYRKFRNPEETADSTYEFFIVHKGNKIWSSQISFWNITCKKRENINTEIEVCLGDDYTCSLKQLLFFAKKTETIDMGIKNSGNYYFSIGRAKYKINNFTLSKLDNNESQKINFYKAKNSIILKKPNTNNRGATQNKENISNINNEGTTQKKLNISNTNNRRPTQKKENTSNTNNEGTTQKKLNISNNNNKENTQKSTPTNNLKIKIPNNNSNKLLRYDLKDRLRDKGQYSFDPEEQNKITEDEKAKKFNDKLLPKIISITDDKLPRLPSKRPKDQQREGDYEEYPLSNDMTSRSTDEVPTTPSGQNLKMGLGITSGIVIMSTYYWFKKVDLATEKKNLKPVKKTKKEKKNKVITSLQQ